MSSDYYTEKMGYVIDGRKIRSREAAVRYLIRRSGMEAYEATRYASRLRAAYYERLAGWKTGRKRNSLSGAEGGVM